MVKQNRGKLIGCHWFACREAGWRGNVRAQREKERVQEKKGCSQVNRWLIHLFFRFSFSLCAVERERERWKCVWREDKMWQKGVTHVTFYEFVCLRVCLWNQWTHLLFLSVSVSLCMCLNFFYSHCVWIQFIKCLHRWPFFRPFKLFMRFFPPLSVCACMCLFGAYTLIKSLLSHIYSWREFAHHSSDKLLESQLLSLSRSATDVFAFHVTFLCNMLIVLPAPSLSLSTVTVRDESVDASKSCSSWKNKLKDIHMHHSLSVCLLLHRREWQRIHCIQERG